MKTQNFYKLIHKFSTETGIPEKQIVDLFLYLKSDQSADNADLSTKIGISKTSINLIQKHFYTLFKPTTNKTVLSENGTRVADYLYDLFPTSQLNTYEFLKSYLTWKPIHQNYVDKRPATERDFDQFLATSDSVIRRATLLSMLNDLKEKRILFLGDDDFTSIEVANSGLPLEVTVADIDTRILNKIDEISKSERLNINTINYDAREPMGKDMYSKYDVVFTDPPYTVNGFSLFLSRAVEALDKKNKSGRIYICFGHSDLSKERFIPIYEKITSAGLMIRYIFDKFTKYSGAESIGSSSALFVCEMTPKTSTLINGKFKENIYTNE